MLVGITGYARSGKDTIGKHLEFHHGFYKLAFADPLKSLAAHIIDRHEIGWDDRTLDWSGPKSDEGRRILQGLGHGARVTIGERVWVDATMRLVDGLLDRGEHVVVTDVRYPNEAEAIKERGGIIWKVMRKDAGLIGAAAEHPTEKNIDDIRADVYFVNDGTIEQLCAWVDSSLWDFGFKFSEDFLSRERLAGRRFD